MIGLKRGIVELKNNDESWAGAAQITMDKLKSLLGDIAIDIQHIGSTSIKAIVAKPVIDLVVGVDDFNDIYALVDKLDKAGFIHRAKNDNVDQIFFSCGDYDNDFITHHIHVVKYKEKTFCNYIFFRDYLNSHPKVATGYEDLKKNLMKRYKNDRGKYTESKAEFIQSILKLY